MNQSELVLDYLKKKPGRKITTSGAMRVTKATSRASMNYLLPTMASQGLIKRVDKGVYTLADTVTVTKTKNTKTSDAPVRTVASTDIKAKLIERKENLLSKVSKIDESIEAIDRATTSASKLLK